MSEIKKPYDKNWEISIMEIREENTIKYKVTRRMPSMSIAETKVFNSKIEAIRQFKEWLN